MRRKDREITDLEEIKAVVEKCDVCRIAINGDDGYPHIVPLNFGCEWQGERLTLYFHSAQEGRKMDLLARDSRVAFEMDCEHEIFSVEERGYCTMNFASVMGRGRIEFIDSEEEKIAALTLLTDRYHEGHFEFGRGALKATRVYRLVAESISAKRHHKTA